MGAIRQLPHSSRRPKPLLPFAGPATRARRRRFSCSRHTTEDVKTLWEDWFEKTHGRWRGFTDNVAARYLDCASPECGFARLRCDACHRERLLLFSCRQRNICPLCDGKRAAVFAAFLHHEVFEDVPHSRWVFTIPKMLRVYFLHHRELLGELSDAPTRPSKNS